MSVAHDTVHNLQAITIFATLVAATLTIYWKTVIKLVIMILATAIITLIIIGTFAVFDVIHG
jgi:hypothetical protein